MAFIESRLLSFNLEVYVCIDLHIMKLRNITV